MLLTMVLNVLFVGVKKKKEIIYNNSQWTQDVAWKTFRKRWMIEMDGEREENPCEQHDMMKNMVSRLPLLYN